MRHLAIRLCLAVTVLGCEPADSGDAGDAGRTLPIAGTEPAGTGDAGPPPQLPPPPPQLTVVEEVRIGSVTDPNYGFTMVSAVAVGPDRRMYVAEYQDRHLRIYDAAGNLVRVVGRRGQGPGEFQSLLHVGLLGDTVWTVDHVTSRLTLFNRNGDLIGTIRANRVSSQGGLLFPKYLRPERSWVSAPILGEIGTEWRSYAFPELLFDSSAVLVDTLRILEGLDPPMSIVMDSVSISFQHLLRDDPIFAHSPGVGTVIVSRTAATSAEQSTFSITSISMSGDTVFDRSVEYQPTPVEAYVGRVVESIGAGSASQGLLGQARLGADRIERAVREVLPAFHPPVSQLRFGEDGAIWMEREREAEDATYWILGPDGAIRGTLTIPRPDRIMWSGTDEVVVMELDDLDVPWLIRYRFQ